MCKGQLVAKWGSMSLENILMLLGGLALFLYGMQMMSVNLEAIAGNRMKSILEKLTSNRFMGVAVGAGITAIIQSSSATTVMVVGFVNSGIMTLKQAVWIIMGANVGTTITGQLIALDVGMIAPLFAFFGVAMLIFTKNKKLEFLGGIIAGLGVLFIGMGMMADSMIPLQSSPEFVSLMTQFSNPIIGILVGMAFTAVIQSSSASVGILQALAMSGLIGIDSAVFVLFGQNIGTCITAVLASIGTNRNAKRTTIIHLLFNVIGTVIFVAISLSTPFVSWVAAFTPTNAAAQIANVHTIFNITTTLLLLPFGNVLAKIATIILPDKKNPEENVDDWLEEIVGSNHVLGTSTLAMHYIANEIKVMFNLVLNNVEDSFGIHESYSQEKFGKIKEKEEKIDKCNVQIAKKISKILTIEQSYVEVKALNNFFKMISNLERIGDHAMNIAEHAQEIDEKNLKLTKQADKEMILMCAKCIEGLSAFKENIPKQEVFEMADTIEQDIDDTTREYRAKLLDRINNQGCQIETAILYSELLTDYERIGDHILNLAESFADLKDFKFNDAHQEA